MVSISEYKGDISKLFDFENPLIMTEALALHKKHEQVVKKLSREFSKRHREKMTK